MFYNNFPLPISLIYTKTLLIYNNFTITNVAFGTILMWRLAAKNGEAIVVQCKFNGIGIYFSKPM